MNVFQFSWSRIEGIGLIALVVGSVFIVHVPIIFFTFELLKISISGFEIGFLATIVGSIIYLSALILSFPEDWEKSKVVNYNSILTTLIVFGGIFLGAFFSFFVFERYIPSEFQPLNVQQRFLSAMTIGLCLVSLVYIIPLKVRDFFK